MTLHLDIPDIARRTLGAEVRSDPEGTPVARVHLSDDESVFMDLDEGGGIWLRAAQPYEHAFGSVITSEEVYRISPALASWKAAEELEAAVLRYEAGKGRKTS